MSELNQWGKVSRVNVDASNNHRLVLWELGANQEGDAEDHTVGFYKSMIHVDGELAGGAVEIWGEIIPGRFAPMTDYDSVALRFLANEIRSSEDRVMKIFPKLVGGDASLTKVTVGLLLVRDK